MAFLRALQDRRPQLPLQAHLFTGLARSLHVEGASTSAKGADAWREAGDVARAWALDTAAEDVAWASKTKDGASRASWLGAGPPPPASDLLLETRRRFAEGTVPISGPGGAVTAGGAGAGTGSSDNSTKR